MSAWRWWAAAGSGPMAAALGYLLRDRAAFFEAVYGRGIAPGVARVLGQLTGALPFSLAELGGLPLAAGILAWLAVRAARGAAAVRSGALPPRTAARAALGIGGRLAALGSVGLAVFYLTWGYAAHRETVGDLLGYPVRPASAEELASLVEELVTEENALRTQVGEDHGVATLQGGVASGLSRAGYVWRRAAERWPLFAGEYARPKPIYFSAAFSGLGLLGVYIPFTGEPNVNVDAPLFGLPFSACHEMAHERGFAREDEANFLSFLVSRDFGDAEFKYAAYFFATTLASISLEDSAPKRAAVLWQEQSPAVMADRAAWTVWADRTRTVASDAASTVNDTYLKAQGAADGVQSYGRMVDLLLAERRTRRR